MCEWGWCFLFFVVTFLLTAVLNLCVVSCDRLTAIVLPMEKRITMRGAKMSIIFTWMMGLTISIPFAVYRNYKVKKNSTTTNNNSQFNFSFYGFYYRHHHLQQQPKKNHILFFFNSCVKKQKERKWKNFVEKLCVENVIILPIYWNVILTLLVLGPLILMIICYSAIFWKVFFFWLLIKYELINNIENWLPFFFSFNFF